MKQKLNKKLSLPWTPQGEKASGNHQIILPRENATREEHWDTMRLANQSAVFFEWTNQRAGYGSRDKFGRVGISGSWDRVWVRVSRGQHGTEAERK